MKKILVAYDATEGAFRALQSTIELAKVFSSEVGVVSVVPMHPGRAPVDPWDDRPVHTEQLHRHARSWSRPASSRRSTSRSATRRRPSSGSPMSRATTRS